MSRLKILKKELKDFCSNVGIQGLRNVSQSDQHPVLR